MQKSTSVQKLTAAALLIAVGVVIPMFSPLKILLEPASFTLASHVAIFLSMFISPGVAAAVSLGTTLGFFFGGFPPVVVARAATHLVFALVGAFYLQKHSSLLKTPAKAVVFSLLIALLHAVCELAVVMPFYFSGGMSANYYNKGFMISVLLLVGVGTIVHSMIDFAISAIILHVLVRERSLKTLFASYSVV